MQTIPWFMGTPHKNNQNLELISPLTLFTKFNTSKMQPSNISSSQCRPCVSPVMMNGCTLNEAPCSECLLGLEWNLYIRSITKRLWKNAQFAVKLQQVSDSSCHALRARSDQKWSIAATSGLEFLNPHFPALTEFKGICAAFWVMNWFPPKNTFITNKRLLTSCYFHCIFLGSTSPDLHS